MVVFVVGTRDREECDVQVAADRLLFPHRDLPQFDLPKPGWPTHPLPDAPAALAWFDTEHLCLLAAQQTATTHAGHQDVSLLAWTMNTFHFRRGCRHDRLAVWQVGLTAAEHLSDPATRILAHRIFGNSYAELGRHDDAISHLHQSLTLAEHHHDHANQAHTHRALSWTWGHWGDKLRALEHATRALDLFRTLGNPVWEAWSLNEVGWYAARFGDHHQARDKCQAARPLSPPPRLRR